ncbi:MAG: Loki-CTERM sorting domain-containing protein, partial [Candidatus Bathyarchaeia archaeon]
FGVVAVGQEKTIENAFTMRVPQDAAPGSYTLDWTYYVVDTGQQLLVASYSIQVTQKTSGGLSITGIPGFPIEAILAGLAGGFVAMTLIRRRRSGQ